MPIERLCVFDQGLGCWTGHWVNFNDNIRLEAARRGLDYVAYGNAKIDGSVLGDLPVRPLFSHLPWTDLSGDSDVDYEKRGDAILADLLPTIDSLSSRDLLLFPTLTSQEIGGILRFGVEAWRQRGAIPVLLAQSTEGINITAGPEANSTTKYFRRALSQLDSPAAFDCFVLLASSAELSVQYSAAFGRPVEPLCMPTTSADETATSLSAAHHCVPPSPLRIGYFGHSSFAKGGHLLNEIVETILERHPNAEFILHINKNPETSEILKVFDVDRPRIFCLRGHITREEYYRQLQRCDIALLPYDRAKYGATPSSVLSEALVAGKIVVGPENTWIAREVWRTNAGATLFGDFNAASIIEALSRAIDQSKKLNILARAASEQMRRSQNVQGFMDGLLAAVRDAGEPDRRRYGWKSPVAQHWHLT